VRWSMGPRDARLATGVRAIYRRLDRRIAAFRRSSGLACLAGCGECCRSTEVEATILELLPLALDLHRRGRTEGVLEPLRGPQFPERCLLFSERALGRFGGHCTEYSRRPLLCRLFGFAAMENREGEPELVACRLIREAEPTLTAEAAESVVRGRLAAPLMRAYTLAMYRLDPVLGSAVLPINAALKQALERVALAQGLSGGRRRKTSRVDTAAGRAYHGA
jgi:Fe-S-cluster containining protein